MNHQLERAGVPTRINNFTNDIKEIKDSLIKFLYDIYESFFVIVCFKALTDVQNKWKKQTHIYIYIYIVVVSLTLIKTTFFGSGHVFQLKLLQQNKLNYIYIHFRVWIKRNVIIGILTDDFLFQSSWLSVCWKMWLLCGFFLNFPYFSLSSHCI